MVGLRARAAHGRSFTYRRGCPISSSLHDYLWTRSVIGPGGLDVIRTCTQGTRFRAMGRGTSDEIEGLHSSSCSSSSFDMPAFSAAKRARLSRNYFVSLF